MMRSLTMLIAMLVPVCSSGQVNQPSPIRSTPQPMVQPLSAVLMNDVDARRAKVGDAIKARVYSGFVAPNSTRVPPGSVVSGHVTEVSKLVKGSTDSRLAVVFDQAQLASGQTVAVHLGIAGLAAAPPTPSLMDAANDPTPTADSRFPTTPTIGNVDPSAQANTQAIPRGTGTNHNTRQPRGQIAYSDIAKGSPQTTSGNQGPAIASVGSTVPGISLQPNPTTHSILVSNSTNVALRNGMPLALLPIADQQQ
ncbi:hypothetical protein [Terriglobus roseus]|nr:hypothetical protein [Terriglobus roseus]